ERSSVNIGLGAAVKAEVVRKSVSRKGVRVRAPPSAPALRLSAREAMHPVMFAAFDRLCRRRGAGGRVLEIGALPGPDSLLNLPALEGATAKVGLSIDGQQRPADYELQHGDAI